MIVHIVKNNKDGTMFPFLTVLSSDMFHLLTRYYYYNADYYLSFTLFKNVHFQSCSHALSKTTASHRIGGYSTNR